MTDITKNVETLEAKVIALIHRAFDEWKTNGSNGRIYKTRNCMAYMATHISKKTGMPIVAVKMMLKPIWDARFDEVVHPSHGTDLPWNNFRLSCPCLFKKKKTTT